MQTIRDARAESDALDEPASEHTAIRATVGHKTVAVEQLQFHLLSPRRYGVRLLDDAYELWRDVWRSTWQEAKGSTEIYSDEFTRQDEIGVLSLGSTPLSVTCMRWLDLSRALAIEDSYFKCWPHEAVTRVAGRQVCVGSNTAVHPEWRRTLIQPPGASGEPARLAFTAIALTVRRFVASPAQSLIALTRNDRSIDRILTALGSTTLARIQVCGIDTDVICVDREKATPATLVVDDLWRRCRQRMIIEQSNDE